MSKPCMNCVYFSECGNTNRTEPCAGRQTKTEREKVAKSLLADLKGTFNRGSLNGAFKSEMLEHGFTENAINLMLECKLIEPQGSEEGDKFYAW